LHRQNLIINKDNCLRFIIAAIAVAKNGPGLATVIIFSVTALSIQAGSVGCRISNTSKANRIKSYMRLMALEVSD
jgi:hypothetical protein